jgi:hypothetical protein
MMPLTITDKQIAAMRALLAADIGTFQRHLDDLGPSEDLGPLGHAAFFLLVERRFAKRPAEAVIAFVGDVRGRSERLAQKVDPIAAERMIRWVYTDESVADIDIDTRKNLVSILIPALAYDEHFDDAQLDELLPEVCKLASEAFG